MIQHAVQAEKFDICKYLLHEGSDPLSTDAGGLTCLDYTIIKAIGALTLEDPTFGDLLDIISVFQARKLDLDDASPSWQPSMCWLGVGCGFLDQPSSIQYQGRINSLRMKGVDLKRLRNKEHTNISWLCLANLAELSDCLSWTENFWAVGTSPDGSDCVGSFAALHMLAFLMHVHRTIRYPNSKTWASRCEYFGNHFAPQAFNKAMKFGANLHAYTTTIYNRYQRQIKITPTILAIMTRNFQAWRDLMHTPHSNIVQMLARDICVYFPSKLESPRPKVQQSTAKYRAFV